MHRIDGPAALPGGFFTEGDPNVGTPATVVTAAFLNALQEEVCGVVEATGAALAKPDNAQLLAAIRWLIDQAVPVGTVMAGYFAAAPAGWLLCSGQVVSRAAYPRLWTHVNGAGLAVSEAAWAASGHGRFSVGDGSTTFRLPDLRSEFLRGFDNGRGLVPSNTLGAWLADEFKSHTHPMGPEFVTEDGGSGGVGGTTSGSPGVAGPTGAAGGAGARPRAVGVAFCVRF